MTITNGKVSFWWHQLGMPDARPALAGSTRADVCIVGAGYTGLWTAYYLKKAAPQLRVVVLEEHFAGYGASGRNGGWVSNDITGGRGRYEREYGREAASNLQQAMNDTVDEIIRVGVDENLDLDLVKGGEVMVATNAAQQIRLEAYARSEQAWPMTDVELLTAEQFSSRIAVAGATGAARHPHCARIQPAKLARALSWLAEGLGVEIFENTRVTEILPHRAVTDHGVVEAQTVVRATEGFTANLRGLHRAWVPLNSSMIVTEPLDRGVWDTIGWEGRETLGDAAHAYIYAQRTSDDRIAIGGRGVPYKFGSRTDVDGETPASTVDALRAVLTRLFPVTADSAIDHTWSGVLGVPRDWTATVGLDRSTGLAWAGGFVGTGVSATNLAARTITDLILERGTEITRLPWVGRRVRNWEIEPLRWIAVNALYRMYGIADRLEARGRRTTSPLAHLADLVSGRNH